MPLRPPAFWTAAPGTSRLAAALSPLGALYHKEVQRRLSRPGEKAGVPVVCVGNATVGGVGKTPFVRMLGEALEERGRAVHVLTRGYGGTEKGPVRVAGHSAKQVGDEPLLLARTLPVWVSRDRPTGARAATEAGAELILMDDGLQNPGLHKDVSVLLVDAAAMFGNGEVFPAGPLRERPEAARERAAAVVSVGADPCEALRTFAAEKPLFTACFALHRRAIPSGPVYAFCGIGRPERFRRSLEEAGRAPVRFESFPDHHVFTQEELSRLRAAAASKDARLVTTEKDFVRLAHSDREGITPIGGSMHCAGLPDLLALIEEHL